MHKRIVLLVFVVIVSACPPGPQGAPGATGPRGFSGLTGPRGFNGSRGATGATGVQGIQGPRGFNGSKGDTGATGAQGLRGPRGFNGTSGSASTEVMFANFVTCTRRVQSAIMPFTGVIVTIVKIDKQAIVYLSGIEGTIANHTAPFVEFAVTGVDASFMPDFNVYGGAGQGESSYGLLDLVVGASWCEDGATIYQCAVQMTFSLLGSTIDVAFRVGPLSGIPISSSNGARFVFNTFAFPYRATS